MVGVPKTWPFFAKAAKLGLRRSTKEGSEGEGGPFMHPVSLSLNEIFAAIVTMEVG